VGRLDKLDLSKSIATRELYRDELRTLQTQFLQYQHRIKETKRALMLVFEGPDAAGKGGIIRRAVEQLDPRSVRVHGIVKPTPEEYDHHYLWRFWNKIPRYGEIAIFDRSWYGRVLVERVENLATKKEWKQAYEELNYFEKTLVDNGILVLKCYIHISKDEQLIRFEKRQADPAKHWKINEEDWRNREKWNEHNAAAEDMFDKTDTKWAPWHLIEGNYKWHARIKTLRMVTRVLCQEFGAAQPC
jgi:polyphosphate kinase 2 (PPK2 family)